jgi:hypothetical protein
MLPHSEPIRLATTLIFSLPVAHVTQLTRFQSQRRFTSANESIASVRGSKKPARKRQLSPRPETPSTLFSKSARYPRKRVTIQTQQNKPQPQPPPGWAKPESPISLSPFGHRFRYLSQRATAR